MKHLLYGLLLAVLVCQPVFAVDVQSSEEFYRAICSTTEQIIRIKTGFRIVEEPADLSASIPCVVARNITVVGDLSDGSYPWVGEWGGKNGVPFVSLLPLPAAPLTVRMAAMCRNATAAAASARKICLLGNLCHQPCHAYSSMAKWVASDR
jgi:hypothetical protein